MTKKTRVILLSVFIVSCCLCISFAILYSKNDDKSDVATVIPDVIEEDSEEVIAEIPVDPERASDVTSELLESKRAKNIEVLETIAACYDTSTESEYYYTGIPCVDNCIHILLGSGEYKLIEDCDDEIDSVPVHLYVVDILDQVYSIVYFPDVEALAIPLRMTAAEYYAGESPDDLKDATAYGY